MRHGAGGPIRILMADDNSDDIYLTTEALRETKMWLDLSVVKNGVETLAFLRGEGAYTGAPRPDLIILDLNMPLKDGRETLAEIKSDPALRTIPVVVLTTSEAEKDIMDAYSLHANCYVTKPVDLTQFIHVVRSIESFWFTIVTLPA